MRIGILGAARIADTGILEPARLLGHEVVAVAARDPKRAAAFAEARGIRRVHDSYLDLVEDPDVDLVYNALVNSKHTEWNIAALRAGKNVLCEKPLASNALEAREVREVAAHSRGRVFEGFHYLHHPVNQKLDELVTSGGLGHIQRVEIILTIPSPPADDPRWSLDLAGGATMDLGCYVLDAARQLGRWIGSAPELRSATATLRDPGVDAGMQVELTYSDGITGRCRWDMDASDRLMTWTVVGSAATAVSMAFGVPHLDNRLIVSRTTSADDARATELRLGERTSYTYQLEAVVTALTDGGTFVTDIDDAVANAELIDSCYRSAGLRPRGQVG